MKYRFVSFPKKIVVYKTYKLSRFARSVKTGRYLQSTVGVIKQANMRGEPIVYWADYSNKTKFIPASLVPTLENCGIQLPLPQYDLELKTAALLRHHPHSKNLALVPFRPVKAIMTPDIQETMQILFRRSSKTLIGLVREALLLSHGMAMIKQLRAVSMFPDEWIKELEPYLRDEGVCETELLRLSSRIAKYLELAGVSKKWMFNFVRRSMETTDYGVVGRAYDTVRMLNEIVGNNYDFNWFNKDSIRDIESVHDAVARAQRERLSTDYGIVPTLTDIKERNPTIHLSIRNYVRLAERLDGMETNVGRLVIPKTAHQLAEWGDTLSNCIYMYAKPMKRCECLLIGLEKNRKMIGAAELVFRLQNDGTLKAYIVQAVKKYNEHFNEFEQELNTVVNKEIEADN